MDVRNERLSDEEFFRERKEVLTMWPTGKDVDLDEAIGYHKSLPASKVYARRLAEAKQNGETLISLLTGTPTLEGQIGIVRNAVENGGADTAQTHQDAFTRHMMLERADEALKESNRRGKATLNGFPIIIHGVAATRKLIESYPPVPARTTGCSTDGRLNAEIAFAGGHTGINYGIFLPFFVYNRDTALETVIRNNQYRCRLVGYYEEKGAPMVYAPEGGVLGGHIIESLLAAEQGVKHLLIGSNGGNLTQSIAHAYCEPSLVREYLDKFGYKDVEVFAHPGGFNIARRWPLDSARAFAILATTALVGVLTSGQECGFTTIDEAHQIPTKEGQAATLRHAKMVMNMYRGQGQVLDLEHNEAVKEEERIAELQTRAVADRVIELGDGDIAIGTVRAFESGVLDSQFSTARGAKRECIMVRDAQGAWRYLDPGNLPFSKEVVEYNKEKLAERAEKEGREIDYEVVIEEYLNVPGEELVAIR